MSTQLKDRAWIEVRADALLANAEAIVASVGVEARLIPMVKADAYGLGLEQAVRQLERLDPWGFGVATAQEGVDLRALGVSRPVVVVSPLSPHAVDRAVASDLQVGVSSLEALEAVVNASSRGSRRVGVHVEIDTGMGRAGFDWRSAAEWGPALKRVCETSVDWVGCYTHLHSADEGSEACREQQARFSQALDALQPPSGVLLHLLNSAGSMRLPEFGFGAVRPGIFLYGGSVGSDLPRPDAVVSVRARVVHIHDVVVNDTVGYGATHRAQVPSTWATLSIGYGDGLPRALGNRGAALVSGQRAPMVGRISMDVTVVDITGIGGVSVGDLATLIGTDGDECITLDEVAGLADTISYEVLTGFTPRLPRIWTGLDGR